LTVRVRCPAKVNLFLSVGPRDARGHHPLRTVFQAIDLCDELLISDETDTDRITSDWDGLPAQNTLTKTRRLLDELVPHRPLHIHLQKRIPVQSGLGGGSSNAAGLLRVIHRFVQAGLPLATLMEVAMAVGADVPFFLVGGRARAEGYGELLRALPDAPRRTLVVAQPDLGVDTRSAYAALDGIAYEWRNFPEDGALYNDFERVAPRACLETIARLRELGAAGAGLSGSGSAVCGLFDCDGHAERAARTLRDKGLRTWLARTLTREESLWTS
jgi:4-diphosphocytidyl-2-C-methyl-D-erythritol kinase